eukprot:scaffold17359_cov142-Isochrysis_galbana.AAC.2
MAGTRLHSRMPWRVSCSAAEASRWRDRSRFISSTTGLPAAVPSRSSVAPTSGRWHPPCRMG